MSIPTITVDLDEPPESRWSGLATHAGAARDMVELYIDDLGGMDEFGGLIDAYLSSLVPQESRAELKAIGELIGVPTSHVALGNLYYDAIKVVLGCTAFALDSPNGPIHARNLDWMSREGTLEKHSVLIRYLRGGAERFTTVAWPGYIGALSGVAPGRFSVTLNAVLSDDSAVMAPPVSLLLRQVLADCEDYESAVSILADTEIPCDCLLLLVGVHEGEFVVIERTPSRAALRHAESGVLVVTNDYRTLEGTGAGVSADELSATSCGRFDRAAELVRARRPQSAEDCLSILRDSEVMMGMTVQQMVFQAASHRLRVWRPDEAASA